MQYSLLKIFCLYMHTSINPNDNPTKYIILFLDNIS